MQEDTAKHPKQLVQRDALVEEYRTYAQALARKFSHTLNVPKGLYDEMVAAANLGLVEAASRYDGSQGTNFRAYAFLRIRGSIVDALRLSVHLQSTGYRLGKALKGVELLREEMLLGKESTDRKKALSELVKFASKAVLTRRMSFDDVPEEAIQSNPAHSPEALSDRKRIAKLFQQFVGELPPRERRVIEAYYFEDKPFLSLIDEDPTLTKSWISRLHSKALERLRLRMAQELKKGD